MTSKNCETLKKMSHKDLVNALGVNRLNNGFVVEDLSETVIHVDDDENEPSVAADIPVETKRESKEELPSGPSETQLQIQNVMSLFEMPAEKFIDDDLDDLELYDFED